MRTMKYQKYNNLQKHTNIVESYKNKLTRKMQSTRLVRIRKIPPTKPPILTQQITADFNLSQEVWN